MATRHWHQEIAESFLLCDYDAFEARAVEQKWQHDSLFVFITEFVEMGLLEIAGAVAGISDSILYSWKNESDGNYHKEFSEVVKKCRFLWSKSRLVELKKKGNESWQSEAWMLERMMPDSFKEVKETAVTSDNANTLTKLLSQQLTANEESTPASEGPDQADSSSDI